ncbi:3'-5' exonuclease domain-containing protein 2 [Prevotella brunnea]|uniref:3'-5' exonuclease domain-containing protein 2 n=1 Tax=Prevotella brunnea TaxID=2508867 RepID=A0A5C8GN50_9BACT|nr:3'-5' exonuclease [Prevotella brunnea]MDR0185786.1 3'-5' exonuclease domain-containing protein 2 [Prevotella brunnea]TXJ63482.1 3'-5' exonuclease domain-containing protein 2 [Prevotella brunnea]
MLTKIYSKFNKKLIPALPRVVFPGRIIVISAEPEAKKAVDYLMAQNILGIDTETRPVFKKGKHNKVALFQVSTHQVCFLFRLNRLGLSPCLIRLLEDTKVLKIGLSLDDDFLMLRQRGEFKKGKFVDLQDIVHEFGIEDLSLQKLYANLFHQRISKREQLTNWENKTLTEKQQLYAATDAWACIKIYERLKELASTQDYETLSEGETLNFNLANQ